MKLPLISKYYQKSINVLKIIFGHVIFWAGPKQFCLLTSDLEGCRGQAGHQVNPRTQTQAPRSCPNQLCGLCRLLVMMMTLNILFTDF